MAFIGVFLHAVQSNNEFLEALTGAQLAVLEKLSSDEKSTEVLVVVLLELLWMFLFHYNSV